MATDDTKQNEPEEVELSQVQELLDRLAAGERLVDAPLAMGLSQDQARAMFAKAAENLRQSTQGSPKKRWPVQGSLLDWRDMTVAEALEILAAEASKQEPEGG